MENMIEFDPSMNERYEDVLFGVLVLKGFHATAEGQKAFKKLVQEELELVRSLHADYNRKLFSETDEVISPYVRYYKKFKKTYHVLPQLESILSGKGFPDTLPLVQVLFMTEIKTSLLIAGHDLEKMKLPLTMHMARGGEEYIGAGGREVALKPNDICLKDQQGYILSIIYGQDEKTRIDEQTTDAFFLIDGVPQLERKHYEEGLKAMLHYINVLDPNITPSEMKVIGCKAK